MKDSELVFWKVLFYVALSLVGALLLVCSCLLGGRHYKDEAIKDAAKFRETLQHQAELWRQERDRRDREYELRLEEQRHKNAAFQQNSEIRDDMDDVMEENRVLREQKDELSSRSERLAQESSRLRMEIAGLAVQLAQSKRSGHEAEPGSGLESRPELRPGPKRVVSVVNVKTLEPVLPERVVEVVNVENEEPELPRNPSSTLFGSGLPPESTYSSKNAIQDGSDNPESHTWLPRNQSTLSGSGLSPGSTYSLEAAVQNGSDSPGSRASSVPPTSELGSPEHTELPPSPSDDGQDPSKLKPASGMMTMGGLLSGSKQRHTWAADSGSSRPAHETDDKWKPASPKKPVSPGKPVPPPKPVSLRRNLSIH
ncbi:hypothetical protein NCS52_00694600 [Fusarium sp. LHS14.1]|nr:hypothetical protein NCS52_00694600 [Fusarium sp. LHS14.1]